MKLIKKVTRMLTGSAHVFRLKELCMDYKTSKNVKVYSSWEDKRVVFVKFIYSFFSNRPRRIKSCTLNISGILLSKLHCLNSVKKLNLLMAFAKASTGCPWMNAYVILTVVVFQADIYRSYIFFIVCEIQSLRIAHKPSFHMKFMKWAFGEFHMMWNDHEYKMDFIALKWTLFQYKRAKMALHRSPE